MTDFRKLTDVATLLKWRAEVLEHVFGGEPAAGIVDANRSFYRRHVADGTHLALVAMYDGTEAGCGSVCLYEEMPSPDNPTGQCAYLMNIYVRGPYRCRGIGSAIVRRLVAYSKAEGCGKIYLETTELGRRVYAGTGFTEMKGFMKYEDTETED